MTNIFDDASSIIIGNKEVSSIKVGNNTIYEKAVVLSGETVTLNFCIVDEFRDANGIGCFLCDSTATYNDVSDISSNVLYSDLIPADPSTQTQSNGKYIWNRTDGFDIQFTIENVPVGDYYIIVAGYDSNNAPVFTLFGNNTNVLSELGTSSDGTLTYNPNLPTGEGCHLITVTENGTNTWYGNSYY